MAPEHALCAAARPPATGHRPPAAAAPGLCYEHQAPAVIAPHEAGPGEGGARVVKQERSTVPDAFAWGLVGLTLLGGLGVLGLQSPVRAGAAFFVALGGAAVLLIALGQPGFGGLVLWVLGGGAGLLLLATVLLLNLSVDETGARRFQLSRLFSLGLVTYLGAALFGLLRDISAPLEGRPELDGVALGRTLFDAHGLGVALAALALASVVVASLVMARRKP